MSTVKDIAFGGEASGFDELAGANPYFTNALIDKAGVIRARPGIAAIAGFPAAPPSTRPVTMMAAFGENLIYATDDGQLFAWTDDGVVAALSTFGGNAVLDASMRPMAANRGSSILVVAAGGAPQKVSSGLVSDRLGGGPPNFGAVVIIARRIVGFLPGSGLIYWSGVLDIDYELWDVGIEFREAEAKGDNLVTLSAAARQLYAFGEETVESYAPDDIATFSPVAAIECGTGAARSVFRWHNDHCWLDDRRQFIKSDCHTFNADSIISGDVQKTLENMSVLYDCWGFRMKKHQHDCLAWVFPTEGRVFVYDPASETWGQWYGWTAGRLGPWAPTSFYYWRERGVHLVGLANGTIAELTFSTYTDLGAPIAWRARSGFNDRGTSTKKAPLMAHMQFQRGAATSDESAVEVTWRDDTGPFVAPLRLPLGTAGETQPTVEITPCGAPYAQRQWEISSTAEDAIAMTAARETYDLLEGVR